MAYSIKYGVDRCPATKNYSHAASCRNCDFRGSEKRDCCECVFYQFRVQEKKEQRLPVH